MDIWERYKGCRKCLCRVLSLLSLLVASVEIMSLRLARLLKIDGLLRSPLHHTAVSIAAALEVSERTIRDDLAFMRDQFDAPIEFTRQKGQHYTEPNWRLPTISLTEGELFALTLGAQMLSAYAGSAYGETLESAIDQLSMRLPETVQADLQALAEKRVIFHPGTTNVNFNPLYWQQLEVACQGLRSVRMVYVAPDDEVTERVVDPYLLRISRANPYVTGFCHLRQGLRDFRVDRIRELEVLTDGFVMDSDFDAQVYLAAPFFYEQGGEPQWVTIWFDAQTAPYIAELRWHSSQQLERQRDGSLVFRVQVRGLEEVKRWVLYYGQGAVVQEPPELVEMVRQEVRAMSKKYMRRRW